MKHLWKGLIALSLFVVAPQTCAEAQHRLDAGEKPDTVTVYVYSPFPPGSLAITTCMGGRVQSIVDMSVIEDKKLFKEIVVHEKAHRDQIENKYKGKCPQYSLEPQRMLIDEIDAYCISRPYAIKRLGSKAKADEDYMKRLQVQFFGEFSPLLVAQLYEIGCP